MNDKFMASQVSENLSVAPGIQLSLNGEKKFGGEYQSMNNQYSLKDFNNQFLSLSGIEARRTSAIEHYLESSGLKRNETKVVEAINLKH